MKKLLANAAFAVGIIASPAVMAADRTITLAVNNMDCAACPSIVKGSLEAVPGVDKRPQPPTMHPVDRARGGRPLPCRNSTTEERNEYSS